MIDATALSDTIEWLHDGCPSAPTAEEALSELCARLSGSGVPLSYGAIFARMLHPEIMGRRWIWHSKIGVTGSSVGYNLFATAQGRR